MGPTSRHASPESMDSEFGCAVRYSDADASSAATRHRRMAMASSDANQILLRRGRQQRVAVEPNCSGLGTTSEYTPLILIAHLDFVFHSSIELTCIEMNRFEVFALELFV